MCFICEEDSVNSHGREDSDHRTCRFCPSIDLLDLSGLQHVKHIGTHILHHHQMKDAENPCRFCLSSNVSCFIWLDHGKINLGKSNCWLICGIKLKTVAKFTECSPCTNHSIECLLCPPGSVAVWKYNLHAHISTTHPSANVDLYKKHYEISTEEIMLMKQVHLVKPHKMQRKQGLQNNIAISEAHSIRMLFRYV